MRTVAIMALLVAASMLQGCTATAYYIQAIRGQWDVIDRAVPIKERVNDPATPPALRARLRRVEQIRNFASSALGLPDNGSYRSYADLKRAFVVWNVFATPEFSVKPIESCFPVAGCVAYRGYYHEVDARAYAKSLRQKGDDVFIGGVPAYSTLGWFDDPVLSTFIRYPEAEVARLIFHELAHQVVYVKDDSAFNESFAVSVAQVGTRRWLAAHGTPQQAAEYALRRARHRAFVALILAYRSRLEAFYKRPLDTQQRRRGKARLFAQMREAYARLKAGWGGYSGYDWVFANGANNALLASINTYTQWVPAFRALLRDVGGKLPAFYARVKKLARLDKPERDARLAALARRG